MDATERVEEILKEAESHLRESAAQFACSANPELEAIRIYGQPDKTAAVQSLFP